VRLHARNISHYRLYTVWGPDVTEPRREAPKVLSCGPSIEQRCRMLGGSGVAGLKSGWTVARNRDHLRSVPPVVVLFGLENLLDGISRNGPLKETTS
jgi:hypothetical protein